MKKKFTVVAICIFALGALVHAQEAPTSKVPIPQESVGQLARDCYGNLSTAHEGIEQEGNSPLVLAYISDAIAFCSKKLSVSQVQLFNSLATPCQTRFGNLEYRRASCQLRAMDYVDSLTVIDGVHQDIDQQHLTAKVMDLFAPEETSVYAGLQGRCASSFSGDSLSSNLRVCELNALVYLESLRTLM